MVKIDWETYRAKEKLQDKGVRSIIETICVLRNRLLPYCDLHPTDQQERISFESYNGSRRIDYLQLTRSLKCAKDLSKESFSFTLDKEDIFNASMWTRYSTLPYTKHLSSPETAERVWNERRERTERRLTLCTSQNVLANPHTSRRNSPLCSAAPLCNPISPTLAGIF